jgi:p-hydroxybenzoate 3-monooxygenase
MDAPGEAPPARGELVERDILDLRVRVLEPMQKGRIFIAGDAAHLVTQAGAKGMNMAILDVIELGAGLCERYGKPGTEYRLAGYTAKRMPEIWRYEESRIGCSASFTPSTRRAPTVMPAPRISPSGCAAAGSIG